MIHKQRVESVAGNVSTGQPVTWFALGRSIGIGLIVLFSIGFITNGFNNGFVVSEMSLSGMKFVMAVVLGVDIGGAALKALQTIGAPRWLEYVGAMAVGILVVNGMSEFLDGRTASILPKAGSGMVAGAIAGLAMYWAEKRGWIKRGAGL